MKSKPYRNHNIFRKGEKMKKFAWIIGIAFIALFSFALMAQQQHAMHMMSAVKKAIAVIIPTKGNTVHGTVIFEQTENGVRVMAHLSGLKPGNHGFHIHEYGDISSDDGSSAGGHFNPTGMPHGSPTDAKRHEGDMGNIVADANGHAHLDYVDHVIKLTGPNSIIGRAIVVHEKEDDFKTQPTGNAGARVGYGVIGIAK
jgi:Cu-Zn family superoxide dismutase